MEELIKSIATNGGFAGLILAWHLLVVNRKLNSLDDAIRRLTNSNLLRLASSPALSPEVRAEVVAQLKENDAATAKADKALL